MKMHLPLRAATIACALACALAASSAGHAATVWDEAVSGDLSNQGAAPTQLTLGLGSNLIVGTTGRSGGVVDRDYFSFTLAPGWQLDSLTVLSGTTFLGGGASFLAVQAGPQVTVNPTGNSPEGLLGWWHYSENDVGTDVLPLLGIGIGAVGFAAPLTAGTYAFWVQDTANGSATYRFDLAVSAVPEPSAALMLLAGVGALAWRRRSLQA